MCLGFWPPGANNRVRSFHVGLRPFGLNSNYFCECPAFWKGNWHIRTFSCSMYMKTFDSPCTSVLRQFSTQSFFFQLCSSLLGGLKRMQNCNWRCISKKCVLENFSDLRLVKILCGTFQQPGLKSSHALKLWLESDDLDQMLIQKGQVLIFSENGTSQKLGILWKLIFASLLCFMIAVPTTTTTRFISNACRRWTQSWRLISEHFRQRGGAWITVPRSIASTKGTCGVWTFMRLSVVSDGFLFVLCDISRDNTSMFWCLSVIIFLLFCLFDPVSANGCQIWSREGRTRRRRTSCESGMPIIRTKRLLFTAHLVRLIV